MDSETLESREKLSDLIATTFSPTRGATNYGAIVDELAHHGLGFIMILFAIPSALPIPAAGYSTILSIPLMAIGIRVLQRRDNIWLPEKMRAAEFNPGKMKKLFGAMLKIVKFVERFSRPRLLGFINSSVTHAFLGTLICCLALSMALPIPGTNTLPAGGIFLIGFALLEDDGLLLLLGILYSAIALCLTLAIIWFGYEAVKLLLTQLL